MACTSDDKYHHYLRHKQGAYSLQQLQIDCSCLFELIVTPRTCKICLLHITVSLAIVMDCAPEG